MTDKRAVWTKRIQAWKRSGLSRAAFCVARRLNVHTFDYWRRTLRPATALVPVMVAPSAAAADPVEVLLPNGIRLQMPLGGDPESLRSLVAVLRAC